MIAAIHMRIAKAQDVRGKPAGSIGCFQDIHSLNSSDERTVGLPVNPSEFRALECRHAPSDLAGRRKHSKAIRMKNGLTVHILRTRPPECDVDLLRAVAETLFDDSRRHSRTRSGGHGVPPYGVALCGAKTAMPTKLPPPRRKSSGQTKSLIHESILLALWIWELRQRSIESLMVME